MRVHILFADKFVYPILQIQDPLMFVLVAKSSLRFAGNRMRIPSPIDNRYPEAKLGHCLGKLIHKYILSTRVRKARSYLPLVNAVVGDHEHMFPPGGKKRFVLLLRIDGYIRHMLLLSFHT